MYIEAPAIYIRECVDCKKYFYFNDSIQLDVNGDKICRDENQEPDCSMCDKYDDKTGEIWTGFTECNDRLFSLFLMCRAFKKLPRTGGMLEQEQLLMDFMLLLSIIFDSGIEIKNKNFQIELAKNSIIR